MKVRVLGSSGGLCPGHLLTSFCIDDALIMDAGSMAEGLDISEQAQVAHIVVTHSHLDHTGTLPFVVDNTFGLRTQPVTVHGIRETIDSIQAHLFNNDIWPDFSVLPNAATPAMRFSALSEETPVKLDHLVVTAVRVNHIVPTVGFVIENRDVSVMFSGDTASTERIWEVAGAKPNLKAVFIEASFPNRLQNIADISGHLTPRTLRDEFAKLGRDVPVFAYHIKPRFLDEIVSELQALGLSNLRISQQGKTYKFE